MEFFRSLLKPLNKKAYFLNSLFFTKLKNFLDFKSIIVNMIMNKAINGIPRKRKSNFFNMNIAPINPKNTLINKLIILSKPTVIVD